MARVTGTDMAEIFSDFVNAGLDKEFDEFVIKVTSDHRTLQRSMFLVMFKCMEEWHDMYIDGNYDDRNEYSLKIAYQMIESLKETKA